MGRRLALRAAVLLATVVLLAFVGAAPLFMVAASGIAVLEAIWQVSRSLGWPIRPLDDAYSSALLQSVFVTACLMIVGLAYGIFEVSHARVGVAAVLAFVGALVTGVGLVKALRELLIRTRKRDRGLGTR